jgi:outer membrane protein assembly factor BamB
MRKINPLALFLLSFSILQSCDSYSEYTPPINSNFPLNQTATYLPSDEIKRLAISNEWMVIYTQDKLTAIDIDTQQVLWSMDATINADTEGFNIVDNVLVTGSKDQILIVDKAGQKRELNLQPEEGFIIQIVAIYPNRIYLIRGPDWILEVYDISNNIQLWTTPVGRGAADVFYDSLKDITYLTTQEKNLRVFDGSSGDILWEMDKSSLHSAFDGSVLYTVEKTNNSNNYMFSALNIESQKELWRSNVTSISVVEMITIINNLLIVSGSNGIIALDSSSGAEVWRTQVGATVSTRPVEFDGYIYVRDHRHTVYAISPDTGEVVGFVKHEDMGDFHFGYETLQGVYRLGDGIIFNNRNSVVIYKSK